MAEQSAVAGVLTLHQPIHWLSASDTLIGHRTENGVAVPTVLPTVGRSGPMPGVFMGALRPDVGNTVGLTTPFSGHYPANLICDTRIERDRVGLSQPKRVKTGVATLKASFLVFHPQILQKNSHRSPRVQPMSKHVCRVGQNIATCAWSKMFVAF